MRQETSITLISSDESLFKELSDLLAPGREIRREAKMHAEKGIVFFDIDSIDPSGIASLGPSALVIAVSAKSDPDTVMRAVTSGAYETLLRPVAKATLDALVDEAVGLADELKRMVELKAPHAAPTCVIVGKSEALLDTCKRLARLSQVDVPVLITGETGTGKELVAESIAQFSSRFGKPFVVINMAAVPETLLESELFGFEKGAFTGAVAAKAGLLKVADKGTVFFDEVGELPLGLQAKLLRFLQTQTFYPIGSTAEVSVDVRVISATNRDIPAMIRQGRFREDLYHRLRVAELHIPPLRERKTDIAPLLEFFVNRYRHTAARPVRGVSRDFLKRLMAHDWPGNIRELENIVRSAIAVSKTACLTTRELAGLGRKEAVEEARARPLTEALSSAIGPWLKQAVSEKEGRVYDEIHRELDRILLDYALMHTADNQSEAARILGINRLTLRKKLGTAGGKGRAESA